MTSGPRLLEKISGFPEEKIKRIIERRENTHIQVLRELKLIKQDDSVEDITSRVLNVELKIEDLDNLTAEFVLVCLFVLDIDNPYLDELIILVLGSSMDNLETKVKKWENLIRKLKEDTVKIKPSKFYKGKPYEDEEKSDKTQQQKTLENQLRGYFPYQTSMEETNLELLQCCVRELQNECIRRWKSGEEFGGLLKKSEWETSYVFGTEKMAQVLRRHLYVADSKKTDTGNSNVSRDKEQMAKKATEMIKKLKKTKEEDKFQNAKDGLTLLKQESVGVCFFRLSDTLQVEGLEMLGSLKMQMSLKKQIEDEVKELNDKPPSKADILRTLTRHSVGILLWKNHCQASVTCVGENVVLTAAHLFTPDKSEIWNHLLQMYCEKMFPLSALKLKTFCNLKQQCYTYLAKSGGNTGSVSEDSFKKFIEDNWETTIKKDISNELELEETKRERDKADNEGIIQELGKTEEKSTSDKVVDDMKEEIKKLAEVREEDLVNLYAEEIKIHIGHMEDVEDHFKAKCCRYYVKEVILLDHNLDVAVLKIAESNDFRLTHGKDDIMYIRQEIVPMPITSAPVPDGHLFIAAHPFRRTLCMESSVKLLDDSEKSVFVENFIIQAILQAVSKNRISILRHVENAETVCARLPVCFFWDKYKYEAVEKLIKRKLYIDGKIAHSGHPEAILGIKIDFKKGFIILKKNPENNETTENNEMKKIPIKTMKDNEKKESSKKAERLLISERELKDGVWQEYSLEKFWHSNLPKRGELQIPIPSANKNRSNGKTTNSGNRQPYRFILTSRYDQASYACQITEDVNDEKKSSLKIKKLGHPIIVEESDKPVVLSLLSEVAFIKCEIRCGEKGEFFLKLDDDRMSDCNGTVKLEKSSGSMRPNTEKPFEIWMNKPFDLPELSLSLQKDSKGKLSLHYSFREGRAKSEKTLYFSLKQEKFLYIELDNEILKKRSGKHISYSVNVAVDEKFRKESWHENVNDKVKDTITKNAEKKNKAIQLKEEEPRKSWTGNILLKRKCTFEYLKRKDTDEHLTHEKYCMLEIRIVENVENDTLAFTAKSELQNARKWKIEEEDYVVWPTFSWSTDFVLQFCKKENSQVTLSIHNTYDSYRIMEFDPNGKQLPRHIHSSENPIIPGINFYVESKRLGKLGSAKRELVQTINRSLSTNEIKENIVTEEFKTSGMKKYIRIEQLAHTKLIDMEHGASGGACCFIGEQGQLLFHGMFLGACPSFYYNNPECKLFFNKTGTCFNEVLPSECLIDKLEGPTGKAKLDSVTPGSFFIKIEN